MSQYKRESHARSLIKGISWRIVATLDTIVVGAIVLWFFDGSVDPVKVLTIAAVEFPLKYLVYYLHERAWEHFRNQEQTDRHRPFKKSISWRIVATTMTFAIAAVVLKGSKEAGTAAFVLAVIEFFSKFALYYVHERIWAGIPLGKIRNLLFKQKSD